MQQCPQCGTTAPAHFVVCPQCHALFHAETLSRWSQEATALEQQGDVAGAVVKLRAMMPLLPAGSVQRKAIEERIATHERGLGGAAPRRPVPKWLAGFGALGVAMWKFIGPVLALLGKGKFLLAGLLKLPTLMSFIVSAALWRDSSSGVGLALVVLGSVYVHEMGHTFAFRRYGIEVTPPMFVPGFGAFVRGTHYPAALQAIGDVALSGPIWGGVTGVVVLAVGMVLDQTWLLGAAVLIAEINLFNLIPVWQLDGSRATACLSRMQVMWLGVTGLLMGALAGSPMGMLAGAGLLVRRVVSPPSGEGDVRTFRVFLGLFVGLLVLRFVAGAVAKMPT